MTKIKVCVGSKQVGLDGEVNDNRRIVEFEGEQLAQRTEYGMHKSGVSDTRGVTETLYRTGRLLVVHVKDWSRWQGEPTTESLHEILPFDLQVGGRFEALGHKAGFGRPLTLDEALAPPPEPTGGYE